jgi:hypothetical protein
MDKLWGFFRLKNGVSREMYKEWARRVDLNTTRFQSGIIRFDIWEALGTEPEESLPFDIVEEFEAESVDAWRKTMSEGIDVRSVITDWSSFGEQASVVMVYGGKLK